MTESTTALVPPDLRLYLDEIAARLHSGHAAVMVGSGFSKNATTSSPSAVEFLDWSQLGDIFYETLNTKPPDRSIQYLSVPTLAHEVEAAIGRPALEQLLRDAIPDRNCEPSTLHVNLLKLPWTDVFTTNYDTLLERACQSITTPRYQIVVNQDDLVYSQRPRIIKLHGSFPSKRPFILTDEDYRRYPKDFAALMNTVRQALIEDTLCLIGFSASDPNFLQWVGWIHDNLGRHNSPRMYLIGTSELSHPRAQLLIRRNIIPIDMSKCADVATNDHYGSLEYFINYLDHKRIDYGRPTWPNNVDSPTDEPKFEEGHISELLATWRKQRITYPGWVVAPADRRRQLWHETEYWASYSDRLNQLSKPLDIRFAYELLWRMEKCLCPVFDDQLSGLEQIIDYYRPPSDQNGTKKLQGRSSTAINADTDLSISGEDLSTMWYYIALSILRYYREEGQLEKWNNLSSELRNYISNMSVANRTRFHYERCLAALFELDIEKLVTELGDWPTDTSNTFWEAKRGALLAELGQVSTANEILEKSLALIRLRSNLRLATTDYSVTSEEGIVMLLLDSVQNSMRHHHRDFKPTEVQHNLVERWHTLSEYGCDPRDELKVFDYSVDSLPINQPTISNEPSFDIGINIRTQRWGGSSKNLLDSYRFLRYCEETGIPFRIPRYAIATNIAKRTLRRVSLYSPYWAMATLVRIGNSSAVDEIFDRPSLAKMNTQSIDGLISIYLSSLFRSMTRIRGVNRLDYSSLRGLIRQVVPEVLSRLVCKCSEESRANLFEFVVQVYDVDSREDYSGIRNLTRRLLSSYSPSLRAKLIPKLLDFRVLPHGRPIEEQEFVNPLFLIGFEEHWVSGQVEINKSKIESLLEAATAIELGTRVNALKTLGVLYELGLLQSKQSRLFADVLWSTTSDDHGFPAATGIERHKFLSLPHPNTVDPVRLFRDYVLRLELRNHAELDSGRVPTEVSSICQAVLSSTDLIQWSMSEISVLVDRLGTWWDTHKDSLRWDDQGEGFSSLINERIQNEVRLVVRALGVIVNSASVSNDSRQIRIRLQRMITELSDYSVPVLRLQVGVLHLFPETRDRVLEELEDAMESSDERDVSDALAAMLVMSSGLDKLASEDDRRDLVRIVRTGSDIVRWRRRVGLSHAMITIASVVREHRWIFSVEIETSLLKGLTHLIDDRRRGPFDRQSTDPDVARRVEALRLRVRRAAAHLAYVLSELYEERGTEAPDVIKIWEEICQSTEEFCEIRNQWIARREDVTENQVE